MDETANTGYVPLNYNLTPSSPVPQSWQAAAANWGYQPRIADPNSLVDYSLTSGGIPKLNTMNVGVDPNANPSMMASFGNWLRQNNVIGQTDAKGIKTDGWGGLALNTLTGLGSLYLGMQQYNLAKETLANNKAQFERNFAANKATINADMEDRQRARVASNAGAYQSVGDYMAQNGVR
jgi:hypothetical protein